MDWAEILFCTVIALAVVTSGTAAWQFMRER